MIKHANHSVVNEIGRTLSPSKKKTFADFITTSFAHVDRLGLRLVKLFPFFFWGAPKEFNSTC